MLIYKQSSIFKLSKYVHIHFALEKEIKKIAILKKHAEAMRFILRQILLLNKYK